MECDHSRTADTRPRTAQLSIADIERSSVVHTLRSRGRGAGRLRRAILAGVLALGGSAAVVTATASPALASHGLTFANAVRTSDGFTFEVTILSSFTGATNITLTPSAGTATISGTSWNQGDQPLLATVTGLTVDQASTVQVSANLLPSGTSLQSIVRPPFSAVAPTLSPATATADGFTFTITDYNTTRYTYTVSATGDATATVDANGLVTVTGLAAAGSATVTVTATANADSGYTGTQSATRTGTARPATPQPPATPAKPTAVVGDSAAEISWVAPAANGAPITGYLVTANPDGATCAGPADATSCVIAGLRNGTAYTFTVVARSSAGDSNASPASDPGTPTAVTSKDLSIDKPSVQPGGTVTLVAEGYRPGTPVNFYLHSDPVLLGTVNANASGVATLTTALPKNLTGGHTARAVGTGLNGLPLSQDIAVTIAASALPVTGARPFVIAGVAIGLVLFGFVFLRAGRRRNFTTA
nr:fibronectin type III domain-containing protein [Planosporangium flavigriseum]